MIPTSPLPFAGALRRFPRALLPTALDSAALRQLDAQVRERSFFSARTLMTDVLDTYQKRITEMVSPKQEKRADRVTPTNPEGFVTVAPDAASVRLQVRELLDGVGYSPDADKAGTVQDLASDARINLVLDYNLTEARAYGHQLQNLDPDFADAYPAQELVRFKSRHEPRDWSALWQSACTEAGDDAALAAFRHSGRMAARKDSGVWLAISDFDRPWPPFKYGSGMGLRDVSRSEAMGLGVIDRDSQIAPPRLAFNEEAAA